MSSPAASDLLELAQRALSQNMVLPSAHVEPTGEDARLIEMDLHRAGRQELGVADEDAEAHRAALRRVLCTWCAVRPQIGYVQGLNCIAAALLVLTDHAVEEASVLLLLLVDRLPADWYIDKLKGGRVECGALLLSFQARRPELFAADSPLRLALSVAGTAAPCETSVRLGPAHTAGRRLFTLGLHDGAQGAHGLGASLRVQARRGC